MAFELAISGDTVLNDAISSCENERFLELIEQTRGADVALTHLETTCHDYDESEVYPAAMSGGTWMRAPRTTGEELRWSGFDIVSHASNHALDFSYGGLRETWDVLDEAGVAYAGTGENLAGAREPAFVDTDEARVGLVSMTASFTPSARAGDARRDMRGRPGVNPLRFTFQVDDETFDAIRTAGTSLGQIVVEEEGTLTVTDPASRNTTRRFERSDDQETHRGLHSRDREENLRAVSWAETEADVVVAHIHTHEFRIGGRATQPPKCLETFSRACIDQGADVVVCQGSHAPTRGIEIYEDAPIFYDPGDFVIMADAVTRQPADFYYAHEEGLSNHPLEASVEEAIQARGPIRPWESRTVFENEREMLSPVGGFFEGPGSVLARCRFDSGYDVERIELTPFQWLSEPESHVGVPKAVEGEAADNTLSHVADLSAEYGTEVTIADDRGYITV